MVIGPGQSHSVALLLTGFPRLLKKQIQGLFKDFPDSVFLKFKGPT